MTTETYFESDSLIAKNEVKLGKNVGLPSQNMISKLVEEGGED